MTSHARCAAPLPTPWPLQRLPQTPTSHPSSRPRMAKFSPVHALCELSSSKTPPMLLPTSLPQYITMDNAESSSPEPSSRTAVLLDYFQANLKLAVFKKCYLNAKISSSRTMGTTCCW